MRWQTSELRILDLDCESRPLSWYGGEWVSKEITAIAWAWVGGNPIPECRLLGRDEPEKILHDFLEAYLQADVVTGHYIRGYDLPVINASLVEHEFSPLPDILAHDTKLDLVKFSGLSKSQENLGAMLGLKSPKEPMNQEMWRQANRLTPEGIRETHRRVTGDVVQHIELRKVLLERGLLGPPKIWRSQASGVGGYHA